MPDVRPMEIRVLGPVELLVRGVPVHLGGPRQRAVFAQLVARAGTAVPTDSLARGVWGDDPPSSVGATLRGYVKHLRRLLDGAPATIVTAGSSYRLDVDEAAIDVVRFEAAVRAAKAALGDGSPGQATELLAGALGLWRDVPYADVPGAGLELEAARLSSIRDVAVEAQMEALVRSGDLHGAIPALEALVAEHPTHEGFSSQLMRALAACGRRTEALRVYGDLRRRLADEIGIEPSSMLQELEQRVLGSPARPRPFEVARRPNPVPVSGTALIGRDGDLARVRAGLGRGRLVTITGAAGVGKTRVAQAVAAGMAEEGSVVSFVELAPAIDGSGVIAAIAGQLGLSAATGVVLDLLVTELDDGPSLLVLDNCEHVIEAAAEVTHALLARSTRLRVLATGREALALPGEQVVGLDGLRLPAETATAAELAGSPAGRLFLDRAGAAAGFVLDEASAPAVARVCRLLDGIPLAIELAVPALRILSPAQLAGTIDGHDALFRPWAEVRSTPERHQALDAAIDWSYQLLDEQHRLLLRCLSVFADRFTLDDAAAVCPAEVDLFTSLSGLVAKSMVARVEGDPPTFRLLTPIRAFARRAWAPGEDRPARDRHARHVLVRVEAQEPRLDTADSVAAHAELDARREDIKLAQAWLLESGDGVGAGRLVAATWKHWDLRYEVGYVLDTVAAVLPRCPDPDVRLAVLVGATHLAWVADDLDLGAAYLEEGLALAGPGRERERGRVLCGGAEVYRGRNDRARVEEVLDEAVGLLRAAGDTWWEAHALRLSMLCALDHGEVLAARERAERCLQLWERCGDPECIAGSHLLLALCDLEVGDPATARVHAEQALAGFRLVSERAAMASAYRALAEAALADRDLATASDLAQRSYDEAERVGFTRGLGEARKLQADVALHQLDLVRAEVWAGEALALFRRRGFVGDVVSGINTLARVVAAGGRQREAIPLCEEALEPFWSGVHRRFAAVPLRLLGVLRASEGDCSAGMALAEESWRRSRAIGYPRGEVEGLLAMAVVAALDGDGARATELADAATRLVEEHAIPLSAKDLSDHRAVADLLAVTQPASDTGAAGPGR